MSVDVQRSLRIGALATLFEGGPATRLFAVIGHPVAHSRSPRFQSAALRALGLDATYVAIDIPPDELATSVERMREAAAAGALAGVNVTVPHKEPIGAHLDRLAPLAQAAGAVNTICFSQRQGVMQLEGRNTDIEGVRAALSDATVSLRGAEVIVLGAGGAARAVVCAALQAEAVAICVACRRVQRGRELVEQLASTWPVARAAVEVVGIDAIPARRWQRARVLVQATSLGLRDGDPSPVDLSAAAPELFVLELVYHRPTALLEQARAAGLRAADGSGVLLHQGAASLRAWTGLEPPLEVMRRHLGPD